MSDLKPGIAEEPERPNMWIGPLLFLVVILTPILIFIFSVLIIFLVGNLHFAVVVSR